MMELQWAGRISGGCQWQSLRVFPFRKIHLKSQGLFPPCSAPLSFWETCFTWVELSGHQEELVVNDSCFSWHLEAVSQCSSVDLRLITSCARIFWYSFSCHYSVVKASSSENSCVLLWIFPECWSNRSPSNQKCVSPGNWALSQKAE